MDRARSLDSPRPGAGLFLPFILTAFTGCEALKSFVAEPERPSAAVAGVELKDLSLASATLLFDVEATNPLPADIPLAKLEYTLSSRGKPFLAGKADAAGAVPARSARAIPVPARVLFAELSRALEGVKPGSVIPYTASFTLHFEVPGSRPFAVAIEKKGELPVPASLEVSLDAVQWEGLSLEKATALLKLRIRNRNQFPLDLSKLTYGLTLGTARVAETSIEQGATFAPDADGSVEVRTSFAPRELGPAAFTALSGAGSSYKLGGTLSVATPYGAIDLPYEKSGETVFRR